MGVKKGKLHSVKQTIYKFKNPAHKPSVPPPPPPAQVVRAVIHLKDVRLPVGKNTAEPILSTLCIESEKQLDTSTFSQLRFVYFATLP